MTIWDIFKRAVSLYSDKIGLVESGQRLTYSELHRRIGSMGNFFLSKSILPGDRISLLDFNSLPFYEAYFAAAGIGAALNPLNYRLSAGELNFIIRDAGSRWLMVNPLFHSQVEQILQEDNLLEGVIWLGESPAASVGCKSYNYQEIVRNPGEFTPVNVDPDDIAYLYYTSGTTGQPKGVILTHKNVCRHALGAVEELELSGSDRWGHIAPMFHLADAWAVFAVTIVGARHVIQHSFNAVDTLKLIQSEKITISNLIPTMLNLMVKCPEVNECDLSSLRVILSGGAPIAPEVVRSIMRTFGCDYIQTYGMTETSPYLTLSILKEHMKKLTPEEQFRFKAKTGRPFITVDLKVVRKDGSEIEPDDEEVGEILVKGETVTPGYWNRPAETEEAFQDGWLKTGDLATIDSEGYVNIVDRKKDMIICGGENIYSIEVENVLYRHPRVLEAAVFGIFDEIWGEAVAAAIVPKTGENLNQEDLIQHCSEHLASFKTPKNIIFMSELPKTGSGKIYKKGLREMVRSGERRGHS